MTRVHRTAALLIVAAFTLAGAEHGAAGAATFRAAAQHQDQNAGAARQKPAPAPAEPRKPYQPELGQDGKNVVWVPSADGIVERMLDMAKVTPADYVIDLGSGDGRTVIAAAKRGAQAHGVEFNPDLVELSKRKAHDAGVAGRATFEKGDLFEADLSRATVVTLFLMEWINIRLQSRLLQLKPGTRVVSNTFGMGQWQPDDTFQVTAACNYYCTALMWIVPARVEGTWDVSPGRLRLTQSFQKVSGALAAWGATRPIAAGRLAGTRLTFRIGAAEYDAAVTGTTMSGTVTTGRDKRPFKATRLN